MDAMNPVLRSAHEVGLAAWFGGSAMGALGLARAAGALPRPEQRARVEGDAWRSWAPAQWGAVAAHLAGAVGLTIANRRRLGLQRGVAPVAAAKAGLTLAALGATTAASLLGRRVGHEMGEGREPGADRVALRAAQWAVPALTGAMLVADALLGEQQRPVPVARGVVARLLRR